MTLEEYVYVKHHDGSSYEDIQNEPGRSIYNNAIAGDTKDMLKQELVTLNVSESYTFNGAAASATADPRIAAWISKMDKDKKITESSISNVRRSVAEEVVDADPSGAFSIQK